MQYDGVSWKNDSISNRQTGRNSALLQGVWRWLIVTLLASAYSAPKTLLVLGDSLSAEYGLTRGSGWVALLDQRLQQQKIPVDIVNASVSGETTMGGKTRLPALLSRHAPDIVIIELGANDALRGLQLNVTQNNLQTLIDMARQAKVLLVGMQILPNYGADYTGKFAQLFPAAARQNKIALVPFFMKDIADKPTLFQADRMHPNEQAQTALLDNVWPYLKLLLNKAQGRTSTPPTACQAYKSQPDCGA